MVLVDPPMTSQGGEGLDVGWSLSFTWVRETKRWGNAPRKLYFFPSEGDFRPGEMSRLGYCLISVKNAINNTTRLVFFL